MRIPIVYPFAITLLFAAGCTDNTVIVTGHTHPATTPDRVQIFFEPPKEKYEVVALVSGSSHNKFGISRQAKTDAAIRGIREKAAEVGANGVIVQESGAQVSGGGGVVAGGVFVAGLDRDVIVNGTAICVP